MRIALVFLAICIVGCLGGGAVVDSSSSGSESKESSASGSGSSSGSGSADTSGNESTTVEAVVTAEATGDATGSATADATVNVGGNGASTAASTVVTDEPTTAPPPVTTTVPGGNPPPPVTGTEPPQPPPPTGSTQPTSSPSTSPPTTAPPTTTSPPTECKGHCSDPDFNGFGYQPGKCGCCPWPCCCKCIPKLGTECRSKLDLGIILDNSGSIGSDDWVLAKQFVNDIVSQLTHIGTDQHVAMVAFSTDARINWNLDSAETSSAAALSNAIGSMGQYTKGFTNTADAIYWATNGVFVPPHDDPKAPNVALLITDGRSNYNKTEIAALSNDLNAKANTICVGITDKIDLDELHLTCDPARTFTEDKFAELSNLLKSLQKEICPQTEECFCCCTPEQFFGSYMRW